MNPIERIKEAVRIYDDKHNFTCDICSREVFTGERLCRQCKERLPWNRAPVCPLCGRKELEEGICLECKQKPLRASKARSVFTHEAEAAELVHRFKKGSAYLYRAAIEVMLPVWKAEFSDADVFTYVPMTKKSRRKRGYNQSELMAQELSRQTGVPLLHAAIKQKETGEQKTLGRQEREKNLEGCFHITNRAGVKGKKVLVIDDTLTTGSTVSELADALLRAGAQTVYALTLTSVRNRNPFGKPLPTEFR